MFVWQDLLQSKENEARKSTHWIWNNVIWLKMTFKKLFQGGAQLFSDWYCIFGFQQRNYLLLVSLQNKSLSVREWKVNSHRFLWCSSSSVSSRCLAIIRNDRLGVWDIMYSFSWISRIFYLPQYRTLSTRQSLALCRIRSTGSSRTGVWPLQS